MDRIQKRFDELAEMAEELVQGATERTRHTGGGTNWITKEPIPVKTHTTETVDFELTTQWQTSVLSLLSRVLGENDPVYVRFRDSLDQGYVNDRSQFAYRRSIFLAAKAEFEGGYLFDVRNLVHAEVFSDELDLATHYLKNDGKTAAAVVAGVVLETTLRKLVNDNGLSGSMLNGMNQNLRDANVYSQIVWRQIQAWADIRNAAAHGKPNEFNDGDVTRMIDGIRDFVAKHMT